MRTPTLPLLLVALPFSLHAQVTDTLVVATRQVPPFAILGEQGVWRGIGIELWEGIASELEIAYRLEEVEGVEASLEAVAGGRADAAVAAYTMTAEREEVLDFTHPFYTSGLSIAVRAEGRGILGTLLSGLFSRTLLTVIVTLALVLLAAGTLVWLFERRRNPQQFGGSPVAGLGSGFWWAAVTMTTVGYGDKAPLTPAGRFVGLIWMFASIIIISGFTAAIATALTVQSLGSAVAGPEDLPGRLVGTVGGSTSETYLVDRRIAVERYATVPEGLAALEAGDVDAVVYDAPLLRYYVNESYRRTLQVLPRTFERQDYAIVLQSGSVLREPVNQVLLEIVAGAEFDRLLERYLGAGE